MFLKSAGMIVDNRWGALALIFLSVAQFSLNWFNITSCFGALTVEMQLSYVDIGLLVAAFLLGYGVFHIPAGLFTAQFGMEAGLRVGLAIQLVGVTASALSPNFEWLFAARVISGVGGSIAIGSAIGLVGAWFHKQEVGFATAMITGVAFTVGAGLGIYAWIPIVGRFGWREALLLGTLVAAANILLLLLFRLTPATEEGATGGHLELKAIGRVLTSPNMWLWGLANFGTYGAYGTAAQLMPGYAQEHLHASADQAGMVSLLLLVSGVPASFLAGWYLDSKAPLKLFFILACFICGFGLLAVPLAGIGWLYGIAAIVGFSLIAANAIWFTAPALYPSEVPIEDIPAAIGLMLTIGAVGGFINPIVFSKIVDAFGFSTAWGLVGTAAALFALLCIWTGKPVRMTTFAVEEAEVS